MVMGEDAHRMCQVMCEDAHRDCPVGWLAVMDSREMKFGRGRPRRASLRKERASHVDARSWLSLMWFNARFSASPR
ncbi:MAG: hypothetical protein JWO38_1335 [Gemmataceae bacterium]|nr:hypothetical protein [Gemmataceae bacterium]